MKHWRHMKLSISPKVHIFEDHAAELQRKHGGVAYKSEDFVELSHQAAYLCQKK